MIEALTILKEKGTPLAYLDKLVTFPEFAKIVEVQRFREMEEKYIPERILEMMYRGRPRTMV